MGCLKPEDHNVSK